MLTVGRWSKLLLSSAEGWEWRFQSKTVKSWEKMHFIQAEIPTLSGLHKTQKKPTSFHLTNTDWKDIHCRDQIWIGMSGVWRTSRNGQLLWYAPGAGPVIVIFPFPPPLPLPPCSPPASSKLCGPHIYGHTGLVLTQEKIPTFIRWLQVTKLDQHQRWGQWASQPFVPLWSILLIPAGFCCYISPGERKAALSTSEMWRAKSPLGEQFPFPWAALSMSQQARLHTWGPGFGALRKRLPYRIPKAKIN